MARVAAFLRGINVGNRRVKNDALSTGGFYDKYARALCHQRAHEHADRD